MAEKRGLLNMVWELVEAGALIESILQRLPGMKGKDERTHSDSPEGMTGRWGFKNQRALVQCAMKLTPQKREATEWFHRNYFVGEGFFGGFRADGRFEDYATAVFTGWASGSREYGSTRTTKRNYNPRPEFKDEEADDGKNRKNQKGGKIPHDLNETVTEEKLYSGSEDIALKFLTHLALTLINARKQFDEGDDDNKTQRGTEKTRGLSEADKAVLRAGHELLKSYHIPTMPEDGQSDWIDMVENSLRFGAEKAPGVYRGIRDVNRDLNRRVAKRQQMERGTWRHLPKRIFAKLLPFS